MTAESDLMICPRCGKRTLMGVSKYNAISIVDKKTQICNFCGNEEVLLDADMAEFLFEPAKALERDKLFRKKLREGTDHDGLAGISTRP